ncbi:hypothetical protein FUAX_11490 [Fulvitalea axinellae]|uniref:Uncharacterized protein n=1 Tax=Fulvitalea axinellae TaxID=1182444 RepID=A0AAU9CP51_9BACT|nr:hypothetical protein FUAX_11490 [Fulvitalea axinellae]
MPIHEFNPAPLTRQGDSFFINRKKTFQGIPVPDELLKRSLRFAFDMTYGQKGQHRPNRSGGDIQRDDWILFANTFQGKLAEFCLQSQLAGAGADIPEPDTETWALGQWDRYDLISDGKKINVKSAAYFSNLLLLEKHDWNDKAEYLPNMEDDPMFYDYFALVRIKPDIKTLFRKQRPKAGQIVTEKFIWPIVKNEIWQYDIPGQLPREAVAHCIQNQKLPKNALLNGRIRMDASNYYIQAGDFRNIHEIIGQKH